MRNSWCRCSESWVNPSADFFTLLYRRPIKVGTTVPIGAISNADCSETGWFLQLREANHCDSFSSAAVYWGDRITAFAPSCADRRSCSQTRQNSSSSCPLNNTLFTGARRPLEKTSQLRAGPRTPAIHFNVWVTH